jgi:hypothetical protein
LLQCKKYKVLNGHVQAFDCLLVMARHARDFVRKRVVTEVFPPLLRFFHTLEQCVKNREHTLTASQAR